MTDFNVETFIFFCRKGVPNSPRIITTGPPPQSTLIATSMAPGTGTSPKGESDFDSTPDSKNESDLDSVRILS